MSICSPHSCRAWLAWRRGSSKVGKHQLSLHMQKDKSRSAQRRMPLHMQKDKSCRSADRRCIDG
jgi:LSD1 subclass zinc finger protein